MINIRLFRQKLKNFYNTIETEIFKKQTIQEVLEIENLRCSYSNYNHSIKEKNPSEILFDVRIDKDYLIGSFDDIPSNINAHGSIISDPQSNGRKSPEIQEIPMNGFSTHGYRKKQMTFGNINLKSGEPNKEFVNEMLTSPDKELIDREKKKFEIPNNTFYNPAFLELEKKGSFKKTYLEDKVSPKKNKPINSGDEHEKTFDISNIPIIASASENSLIAKPNPSDKKKKQKEKKNNFFTDRYESLKHRQLLEKKFKSSKKNIINQRNLKNKNEESNKKIKKDLKNKYKKREIVEDLIFTKHSSEKSLFSAKKRAKKMANRESQNDKSEPNSPKNNMFLLNDFDEFNLGDSVCDNAIFISNKYDFMAIGGRISRKLKLFSFEKNNFQLDCELKIFKSEPTDIHFYGIKTN